jgi:hypothetical protein
MKAGDVAFARTHPADKWTCPVCGLASAVMVHCARCKARQCRDCHEAHEERCEMPPAEGKP